MIEYAATPPAAPAAKPIAFCLKLFLECLQTKIKYALWFRHAQLAYGRLI